MVTADQINEVISNYFSHGDANKFVAEFSPLSHNIHKNGDSDAIALVNEIESKLADLRGGFISKAVFSDSLSNLINPFVLNFSVPIGFYRPDDFIRFAVDPGKASSELAGFFGIGLATESESERLLPR